MNLYIKLFLTTGVPFGLVIGLFSALSNGVAVGLSSGLAQGFFFGITMSIVLGTMHKLKTKAQSRRTSGTGPNQNVEITLEGSKERCFQKCLSSLIELQVKIINKDSEGGVIEGQTNWTWKSFGEKIHLTVTENGKGKVKVMVSSIPKWKPTVVDYGKGIENVDSIIKSLKL